MQVLIKLNEPLGANLGPFQLTTDLGTITPSTVNRADVINGVVVNLSDDDATSITVTSTGICNTSSITLIIDNKPT